MDKRSKALDVIGRIAGKEAKELNEKDELVADLGIDSPKALQLLIELEDALGVEISDDDAAKMDTVGDILTQVA